MGPLSEADTAGPDPRDSAGLPDVPATPPPVRPVLELVERDGQVRLLATVTHWPLRIGRALDNDVVLGDPHIAAHHLRVSETAGGIAVDVGDTRNGARVGTTRLRAGGQAHVAAGDDPIALTLGRTRLRLRLPKHAIAPEIALVPPGSLARHAAFFVIAIGVVLLGTVFTTYLNTDPDRFGNTAASTLLGAFAGAAVWCGAWALLSKTFAHQARFAWHLRVFLLATIGLFAVRLVPPLLAFMFSWPWASDFSFVPEIAVAAAALYFHLLAVEPARRRLLKTVAAVCAAVGVGLSLWFNVQRSDLLGQEMYMGHLFPPALRVAPPVSTEAFIGGLAPLKATLDRKARVADRGDDDGEPDDDN